jgi:predicted O-linked N-acetylglucosamine transferase (SPINDLY family)
MTPVLQQQPRFQQAMACHQQGRLAEAQALYLALLKSYPHNAQLLGMLGSLCLQTGNRADCIKYCEQSVSLDGQQPFVWFYLATAYKQQQRLAEALAAYDKTLQLKADYPEAWCNRGNVLIDLHRLAEALLSFEQAIKLQPGLALAHFNKGNVYRELKRYAEAVACYQQTLMFNPRLAEAHCNLGTAYKELQNFPAAISHYQQALRLKPDFAFLPGQLLFTRLQCCDWQDFASAQAEINNKIGAGLAVAFPFHAQAFIDHPAQLLQTAASWTQRKFPPDDSQPLTAAIKGHERIRLAYFSADFRQHPVAQLTARLFELHDREQFELYAFYSGSIHDEMTARLQPLFEHFIDIHPLDDQQVMALARSLEIDIAVDLGGHTQDCRTGLFAKRLAAIQVNFLGYPGSMGAAYMDYLLADQQLIPDQQQQFYSEHIVYMPHSYLVTDNRQPVAGQSFTRQDFQLPEQGVVFCCFNNAYKINPPLFDSWCSILTAVPDSVLWLSVEQPVAQENLRRELLSRGLSANRLVFAQRLPNLADHLARLQLADLFLDTLPYNAHTTACDALWAGLPLVTCRGAGFAGRVAASLLHAMDMPELVTDSVAEYEALAIALASQPDQLAAVKSRLLVNRKSCALFDTERYTRHLETAFQIMQQRQTAGLPPSMLVVTD